METPDSESYPDLAPLVCLPCKARKRKCDKTRPRCSTCSKYVKSKSRWASFHYSLTLELHSHKSVRSELTCSYDYPPRTRPSPSTIDLFRHSISIYGTARDSRPEALDFSTILFLSPSLLQQGQLSLPSPGHLIPPEILSLLDSPLSIHSTATIFFTHIHTWMPFISKARFYSHHRPPSSFSSFPSRPDIALLLLALKLITTLPPSRPGSAQTQLYHATKHYFVEVESSSIFSLAVLQAGLLIALYELGHAIYPAAYLSIGAAARYALALGIGAGEKVEGGSRVTTLVEVEERRRVWWAIVILDRFVNVGCPGRPFATEDPKSEDLLPADDAAWDDGVVNTDDLCTLSSPNVGHMSKFALLCQAARILGQVLRYISSDASIDDDESGIQLDRTLQSMIAAALDFDAPDYDQISFIHSTLVALHYPWLYSDSTNQVDTGRCDRARAVIQQITQKIRANLIANQCFLGRDPEDMSPWGLFFAYHVCVFHMRVTRGTSSAPAEVVKSLKETFAAIDVRWNAAGVYLQLLEAQQVMF